MTGKGSCSVLEHMGDSNVQILHITFPFMHKFMILNPLDSKDSCRKFCDNSSKF